MLPCVESLGPGARQGASCLGWLALASPLGVAIRKLSCQNRAPGSATEIMALCRVLSPSDHAGKRRVPRPRLAGMSRWIPWTAWDVSAQFVQDWLLDSDRAKLQMQATGEPDCGGIHSGVKLRTGSEPPPHDGFRAAEAVDLPAPVPHELM